MDFSTKFTVRTDLADEAIDGFRRKKGIIGDGITFETDEKSGIRVDTVTVLDDKSGESIGKPKGTYITASVGEIWKKGRSEFENAAKVIADSVKSMIDGNGLCLVVCLGNDKIISDAIGPMSAKSIIVSRHIKLQNKEMFDALGLGECACITPGVTGNTGAEAYELVKAAVESLMPSSVIVIDALCARDVSRLAKTVQICSAGIIPGSGVGNARNEISSKTLGVPTVAIGVPTVVEALTLSLDILSDALGEKKAVYDFVASKLSGNMGRFFVCPKETDKIAGSISKLIGYSVNLCVHSGMTISEMDELLS